MKNLLFLFCFCSSIHVAEAAFVKDTSFISYEEFDRLSKKEIKQKFGTDAESKFIINHYYRNKNNGLLWIIPSLLLNAGGVYFTTLSNNATNGMAGTVGLVLAIALFIPGIISLYLFGKRFLFRKKPKKKELYDKLKAHHQK